jgi:hypothetical protein
MAVLDWLQQLLGGARDEGAPMATQNPQTGEFSPYRPPAAPDVLDTLYQLSGGQDMSEAYKAYQRGEYLPAFGQGAWGAAQAASMAAPALRVGGAALRAGAPLAREAAAAMPGLLADETGAIRAWHASPYDFDKFDLSKIGTGQGAASYGHGLYLAESPAVSGPRGSYDLEFTAKNLGKYDLNQGEGDILRLLRGGASDMDVLGELARSGGYTFDEAAAALERVKAAKAKLYEVDIHADPNAFLNWDKPLSGQPGVQQTLAKAGIINLRSEFPEVLARANTQTGGEIYESSKLVPGAYRDPQAASAALREMGIPGIRYLDQGSRQYQIEPLVTPPISGKLSMLAVSWLQRPRLSRVLKIGCGKIPAATTSCLTTS